MEIKLLSCPLCLKPHFEGVDSLRSTLISAATSQISCPVCNEMLLGLDKLTIHLFVHISSDNKEMKSNHHPEQLENREPKDFRNEEAKELINNNKIIEGTLANYLEERVLSCNICNFTFADENILEMHQKLVHQTSEDGKTGGYSYQCHLCSKRFKMRGSLMVHLRIAHYGFNSGNKNELKNDDGKGGKQWNCDVCFKTFTTKYFLKKHKRLHTGEMPFFCAICNKYFTFQQSYHKHMSYHSTEKPHICSECGRAFKELSTLHNHERIHSGERPFACETCGKCFRQRVAYLVHKRIHTGIMPYKCTACDKTFRYKVSQRSHKCPMNPPGIVIKTIPENQTVAISSPKENTIEIPVKAINNDNLVDRNFEINMNVDNLVNLEHVDENVNTIILNENGQIIGQNFLFDGENLVAIKNKDEEFVNSLVLIPDSAVIHESSEENKSNPDFFSMVMSPNLPDLESLNIDKTTKNNTNVLQTINEERFKELLYGASYSPG